MNKIIKLLALSLIIAAILFVACKSKNIIAEGKSSPQPDVYVAGYVEMPWKEDRSTDIATVWKNGIAQYLTDGTAGYAEARSVFVSGEDVYVAGYEGNVAMLWKNGLAQNLTDGTLVARAYSVFVSGKDVYVAGYIDKPYTEFYETSIFTGMDTTILVCSAHATVWKNGVAQNLTEGIAGYAEAHSIFVSGDDVYVAGYEGESINTVAMLWKNGVAQKLFDGGANSVFVLGNDVYVAGAGINTFEIEADNDVIDDYIEGPRIYRFPFAVLWKDGVAQKLVDENTVTVLSHEDLDKVEISAANSVFVSGNDVYVTGYEGGRGESDRLYMLWKNGVAQKFADSSYWDSSSVFVLDNDVYTTGGRTTSVWKNGVEQNLVVDETAISSRTYSVFVNTKK